MPVDDAFATPVTLPIHSGTAQMHSPVRLADAFAVRLPAGASNIGRQLTGSTVVHCHHRLGRSYLPALAPFHRMVVKASLRRAAQVGWPHVATGA